VSEHVLHRFFHHHFGNAWAIFREEPDPEHVGIGAAIDKPVDDSLVFLFIALKHTTVIVAFTTIVLLQQLVQRAKKRRTRFVSCVAVVAHASDVLMNVLAERAP